MDELNVFHCTFQVVWVWNRAVTYLNYMVKSRRDCDVNFIYEIVVLFVVW